MTSVYLRNPHLEGGPFFWKGGRTGALLIHGLTATTAEVRPLARYLHAKGYTVAGPLLPGHLAEPEDVNRYHWQDWARTVGEAYSDLRSRCERVIVGGESTGAMLSLYLASDHPEIAALLLYAPALRLTLRKRDEMRLRVALHFTPHIPKGPSRPSDADALWQGYTVNPLKGGRELLRLQSVVRGRLGLIRQPVFIAQGRLDKTVHPGAPQEIYQRVASPVKELFWFERSTHCVALDCERHELFERSNEFLERVKETAEVVK